MGAKVRPENFKGNKNSGRKTVAEEIAYAKEKIKEQTIEELAESKVFGHLITIEEGKDRQGVKDIALPVYLKSKADKKEVNGTLEIKTITGMVIEKDDNKC